MTAAAILVFIANGGDDLDRGAAIRRSLQAEEQGWSWRHLGHCHVGRNHLPAAADSCGGLPGAVVRGGLRLRGPGNKKPR